MLMEMSSGKKIAFTHMIHLICILQIVIIKCYCDLEKKDGFVLRLILFIKNFPYDYLLQTYTYALILMV